MLRILLSISFIFINGWMLCLYGQQPEDKPLSFSFSYLGDFAGCYHGGIRNGYAWLGMVDVSASLNTAGANLWKGGNLFVNIQNTHNSAPGTQLAGDLQVFDNIDNGNQTYLYQLWYRQHSGKFWFLAGLHDLNSEFFTGENSSDFINSSFGIMPVASLNSPVSIFPNTSLAFLTGYITEKFEIKAGIYEGDPGDPEKDPLNLDLVPDFHKGLVGIIETAIFHNSENERNGVYRAGLLVHTGNPSWINDTANISRGNYHIYITADQRICSGLDFFMQAGMAPADRNLNDLCFSAGLRYTGLFTGKSTESTGIAIAHASISNSLLRRRDVYLNSSETVMEFFYRTNLSQRIYFQPDLQYIINPGIDPDIQNAIVGILRIGIIF